VVACWRVDCERRANLNGITRFIGPLQIAASVTSTTVEPKKNRPIS